MAMSFDDLSRALAKGVTRRQAVKLVGGAVVGGLLTTLHLDSVRAAPDPCNVFCGKTANTSGAAHAACVQACHKCGGNVQNLCFGPTSVTCCQNGTICANGQCQTPFTCSGHGCGVACPSPAGGCGCVTTAEGTTACVQEMCTFTSCTSSADCGAGSVCFTERCCGTGSFCVPLCTA